MGNKRSRACTFLAAFALAASAVSATSLEQAFETPPDSARPWVYWLKFADT